MKLIFDALNNIGSHYGSGSISTMDSDEAIAGGRTVFVKLRSVPFCRTL